MAFSQHHLAAAAATTRLSAPDGHASAPCHLSVIYCVNRFPFNPVTSFFVVAVAAVVVAAVVVGDVVGGGKGEGGGSNRISYLSLELGSI